MSCQTHRVISVWREGERREIKRDKINIKKIKRGKEANKACMVTHQADENIGGGSKGLDGICVQAEGQEAPKGVDDALDDPKVEQHADYCIEEQQNGHSLKKRL